MDTMKSQELLPKPINFLDEDAKYFRIVLNFLRNEEVFTCDERNFFGVQNLAKNLEFAELVKFLERQHGT